MYVLAKCPSEDLLPQNELARQKKLQDNGKEGRKKGGDVDKTDNTQLN